MRFSPSVAGISGLLYSFLSVPLVHALSLAEVGAASPLGEALPSIVADRAQAGAVDLSRAVPDGGESVALLGLALLGLAFWTMKLKRN